MKYFTTTTAASRRTGGCVIVGIYESGKPGKGAADIDKATQGVIRKLVKSGDLSGRLGEARMLVSLPNIRAQRVVVTGLGKREKFGISAFRQAVTAAVAALKDSKARDVVNYLTLEKIAGVEPYYLARYTVESIGSVLYRFTAMKSGRKEPPPTLQRIGLALAGKGDQGWC